MLSDITVTTNQSQLLSLLPSVLIAALFIIIAHKSISSTEIAKKRSDKNSNPNNLPNPDPTLSSKPSLMSLILSRLRRNDDASISTQSPNKEEPQYFSGQYEYEVSPKSSPPNSSSSQHASSINTVDAATAELVITEKMVPVTKTVYLIRHAESDENRRLASLSKSVKGLGRLRLPRKADLVASIELINLPAQIDSDVSPVGKAQINALGRKIASDDFAKKMGIQLVAHSPLKRARQTSEGMLGCVTPNPNVTIEQDYSAEGKKAPTVGRVVELPILKERTPMEWMPKMYDAFTKRIFSFEQWLGEQPEDVIAIVGHSQYFKSMLGLPKKFKNCDVWSLQFDYSVKMSHESVKEEINTTERAEKQKKLRSKLNNALNNASPFKDEKKDEVETEGDVLHRSVEEVRESNEESEVFESANEIYEIDGVRVDDLELPRGWRELKRHYTYDPSMEEPVAPVAQEETEGKVE
jgi:broad specificity phosphatase PhoE